MASLKERFQNIAEGEGGTLGFDPLANDTARLATLRVEDIEPDPGQPRTDMGDLQGIMDSIQKHGIMQPLIVSPLDETRYQIIAGERRYTAARQLGLRTVPALVRTAQDHQRLELQLIENLHRKDLNAFEEARAYQRLVDEFNLVHEVIADQVGKSRSHVTQILAVNRIPEEIRIACREANVSRETLFLIAKQDEVERMWAILEAARDGRPKEDQREIARKGPSRSSSESSPSRKPKRQFGTTCDATVIVQSLTETLNTEQILGALQQAFEQAGQEQAQ